MFQAAFGPLVFGGCFVAVKVALKLDSLDNFLQDQT